MPIDREHQEYLDKKYNHGTPAPLPVDPYSGVATGRLLEWELAKAREREELQTRRLG